MTCFLMALARVPLKLRARAKEQISEALKPVEKEPHTMLTTEKKTPTVVTFETEKEKRSFEEAIQTKNPKSLLAESLTIREVVVDGIPVLRIAKLVKKPVIVEVKTTHAS